MKQIVSRVSIRWVMLLLPILALLILSNVGTAVRATTATASNEYQRSILAPTRLLSAGLTLPQATARAGRMTMPVGMVMAGMVMTGKPSTGTTMRLHQKVVRVTIFNFAFRPARLVVSPGTRIIWTNKDSDPHTVDSMTNVWSSDALDTGNTFARVFAKVGAFTYYCSIHPFMHGEIIVKK